MIILQANKVERSFVVRSSLYINLQMNETNCSYRKNGAGKSTLKDFGWEEAS